MEVILLEEMLEDIEIISKSGEYISGNFVSSNDVIEEIKAIVMPIDQRSLELLPEGSTYNNSIKIYSKHEINDLSETYLLRKLTNIIYRVHNDKNFKNIDNLNIYIASIDKDGGKWEHF